MDRSAPVFFALLIGIFAACAPLQGGSTKSFPIAAVGLLASGQPSKAQGKVEVSARGDGMTRIAITLTGLEPGSKHAGHIHTGSCANGGPVAVALDEIVADTNGKGSSEKILETGKLPVAAYVNYHQKGSAGGVGSGIACGDIR